YEASRSIEMGIVTALSEVSNVINGQQIMVKRMDHHGNSKRSKRHIKAYLKSDQALVMFSGLHSPPLLANKRFINENEVLYLDPWAAAGPITRVRRGKNWIFRLSIDDNKAAKKLVDFLWKKKNLKKPLLILENTGWGKSNNRNMKIALLTHGVKEVGVRWFDWNISRMDAEEIAQSIKNDGYDSVLLVANSLEAVKLIQAIARLDESRRVPIISHWGITGGNFPIMVDQNTRSKIDLSFLQTRFSFLNTSLNDFQKDVFKRAQKMFPEELRDYQDLKAPTGFIHAYDLTKLLLHSISKSTLSGDMIKDRDTIRLALENINQKIEGLIKTYIHPFNGKINDLDGHEALDRADYAMGIYGASNEIRLIKE
ncbi:ABC transporter substrate-binding protein, partial [bacterium]|nr:ABC transporter substrate-binding protein [bacterium]